MAQSPGTELSRRASQLCREGHEVGHSSKHHDTCFILYATFFVGAPVKNARGQPSLSRQEGPQERGFGLLALSRDRNKVKAFSLLEKDTVCVWAFILRIKR